MAPTSQAPEPLEDDSHTRGLSRTGCIFLLWTIAISLFLIAIQFGGLENMSIMRILAGSPKPWAERIDIHAGSWGLTFPLLRTIIALITAALFALIANGLKRKKRWSVWTGIALTSIYLILNTIVLASDIIYVYSMLNNESGRAFGLPEPVWRDVPLILPSLLIILEIVMLILLRLLTKLRVDVLH